MPIEIVRDVEKRCKSGSLKGWEQRLKEKNNLNCHELGEAIAAMVENNSNNSQRFYKDALEEADMIVMHYRDVQDFIQDTLYWKAIDLKNGIFGLFGKLDQTAAPEDYKGEDYAVMFQFEKHDWTPDKAIEWAKQSNYKADTVEIKGIEILRFGTWNGDIYDKKRFEQMINAFEQGIYVAGLKLGHNKTQKALREFLDGMPRFGNLNKLYEKGDKLLGDFTNVPRKLAMLLEAKAFPDKSVEIRWNLKRNGRVWPCVLTAVAFSGEFIPAVEGLSDTIALYEEEKAAKSLDKDGIKVYNLSNESNLMKHTKEWHKCVEKVASRGDVTSPEAVCTWSLERTGNVYMKEEKDAEPELKNLKVLMISLNELKTLDPTFANELEVDGFSGIAVDLGNEYKITKLKLGEVTNKMAMTPDEQKQLESALKQRDEAEKKLKIETDAKEKVTKEKEAKDAELKSIREKETDAEITKTVATLLKSKIKKESVDALVTLYKAVDAVAKVSCYSLKDDKITKGEEKSLKEVLVQFVESLPENSEVVKLFSESATNTNGGGADKKGMEGADEESVILADKVNKYLKDNKLDKTTKNMKKAVNAVLE